MRIGDPRVTVLVAGESLITSDHASGSISEVLPGPPSTLPRVVEPRIVDLFAGPGGLDVAARWLGVPATGIEWDPDACRTREKAGLDTVCGDVRDSDPTQFEEANVLCGGPPCQTFTVAGSGSGRRALDEVRRLAHRLAADRRLSAETLDNLEDERTGLVLEPLRWILAAHDCGRPYEAIILEQVQAVRPLWDTVAEILRGEGYTAEVKVLSAEEYGVPQTRRRAILVARRGLDNVTHPAPTHQAYRRGVAPDPSHRLEPWKSMGQALGREGFYVRSNYGTGGNPRARGRRDWEQPSATVTGKIGRNWVSGGGDVGRFSHREAGILQTFPVNFPWQGRDIDQQIGNAIPPRLAAHVLDSVLGLGTPSGAYDEFVARPWAPEGLGSVKLSVSDVADLDHIAPDRSAAPVV